MLVKYLRSEDAGKEDFAEITRQDSNRSDVPVQVVIIVETEGWNGINFQNQHHLSAARFKLVLCFPVIFGLQKVMSYRVYKTRSLIVIS